MSLPLQKLLDDMHTAILTRDGEQVGLRIRPHPRLTPEQQLAIYSDGYRLRLAAAIRSDYPELLAWLGNAEFDRLALAYIEATPPSHFNLDRYPHGFAATLPSHCTDAFALDLARFEAAIAEVFMAEESAPLAADALSSFTPEQFAGVAFVPRAASRLLHLRYPVLDLLADRRGEKAPSPQPCDLFLVRHRNEVRKHALAPAEAWLLAALCSGQPVAEALESVTARHPEGARDIADNLHPWFARWTGEGFFQAVRVSS